MTDLETMRAMLLKAKIEFTEEVMSAVVWLTMEVGTQGVTGYSGFKTSLAFHEGSGAMATVLIGEGA